MPDDVDPLDDGVPRNGRGAPLIIPVKRGKPDPKAKLAPYVRASTFAKALDDGQGLTTWKIRHAVLGVAQSPDLAAMAGALGRDLNDFTPQDKRDLDAIIDRAHDRSGGNVKADYGTAVHSLTEDDPLAEDARERHTAESMTADVESYQAALDAAGLVTVEAEVFIVNDKLTVAGTFDHKYRLTRDLTVPDVCELPAGTLLIGDKKTGTLHLGSTAIQLATYARGQVYDHVTGERAALDVSPQWGVIAHIERGKGHTALYLVNLSDGWKGALLSQEVRAFRSAPAQRKLGTLIGEVTVEPAPVDPAPNIEPATLAEVVNIAEPATVDIMAYGESEPVATITVGGKEFEKIKGAAWPKDEPSPASEVVDDATAVARIAQTLDAVEIVDPILAAINEAPDNDACVALWALHKANWSPAHTEAAKTRLAALQQAA